MINKYKNQIMLGIFTSIILISFLVLVLKDNNTKYITKKKITETTSITKAETTTDIGAETTASEPETTGITQTWKIYDSI